MSWTRWPRAEHRSAMTSSPSGGPSAARPTLRPSSTPPARPGGRKDAQLTHGNLLADVRNAVEGSLSDIFEIPGGSTMLFLPLAHSFARVIQVGCLESGAILGHWPDSRTLVQGLAGFQPTFLLAVPRVFEKVYNSAQQHAAASKARSRIFSAAAETAIAWSKSAGGGAVSGAASGGGPGGGAGGADGGAGGADAARRGLTARPGRAARPDGAGRCGSGTRCSTGSSTPGSGRRLAAGSSTRSPAARHWATGLGISSAVPACPCWRATGSPRPQRPRP